MSKKKRDHKKAAAKYKKSKVAHTLKSEEFKIEDWFAKNIQPKLKDLDSRIMSTKVTDDDTAMVKYWWHAFYQNSLNLADLVGSPSSHYQVASTMRLLLEVSADIGFIGEYPENIKHIVDAQNNIAEKQAKNPRYSYRNAIEDAHRVKLHAYLENGKQKTISTIDRIKLIYKKVLGDDVMHTVDQVYGLLSLYSHFNPAAIVWEGNKTRVTQDLDAALQDNLYMFYFYPLFLNCTVISIAGLLGDDSLKEYGKDEIQKLFNDTKKWRAADE